MASRRFKAATAALILLGVFLFVNIFSLTDEVVRVDKWQQATKIHYQLGARPLFEEGRYETAISELDNCLALVPDFSPARNLRGKAYAILGRHKEALDDFKKVVALSPGVAEGFRNIGLLYALRGEAQTARDYLSRALALGPDDTKVREALAKLKGE